MLKDSMKNKIVLIEECLQELIKGKEDVPVIYEAIKYSVDAGGKRIRPILCLMSNELFDGDVEEVLPFACAIEMIHTYSLIHDDLPCMDDDDYRRGQPSNHKKFGEGYATLAGDALLNLAFETMLSASIENKSPNALQAAHVIAKASGATGMIGGQCIDLFYENKTINLDTLNKMYTLKTGALLNAPLVVGALLANTTEENVSIIQKFGKLIGLTFQITDDILDVIGEEEKLGKAIGSDVSNNKSTYVRLLGLDETRRIAKELTEQAIATISVFGQKAIPFIELANYIYEREK